MTYFSKEDVQKMAYLATTVFDRPDLADAIVFTAYTGVRQGELLKLKSEDIDLARDLIWVGGKPKRETKGNNVRSVFIHELVKPIIHEPLGPVLPLQGRLEQQRPALRSVQKGSGLRRSPGRSRLALPPPQLRHLAR